MSARRRRALGRQIARWQGNLIDLEIVAADQRRIVDREIASWLEDLRRHREAEAHLAHLLEWLDGLGATGEGTCRR
jgi:hypothetical protein